MGDNQESKLFSVSVQEINTAKPVFILWYHLSIPCVVLQWNTKRAALSQGWAHNRGDTVCKNHEIW